MDNINGKRDLISFGGTSLVERLPNGDIIKMPLDPFREVGERELVIEASIYQRLGQHPRLISIRSWDEKSHALVMEYMPNGTL